MHIPRAQAYALALYLVHEYTIYRRNWFVRIKERAEGRRPTTVAKKRSESVILDVSLLQLLPLAFFLGSLVVQVACWAYAPNKER